MYALKITNATILSGIAGEEPRAGALAVKDGRIAAIAPELSGPARQVLDAGGAVVCPGFIDLHTHCVAAASTNFLQMGVTFAVAGNCGFSTLSATVAADRCAGKCGPNLACLVGHNTVRIAAMGNANRAPTPSELDRMRALIAADMQAGAVGFSAGLTYVPGHYAATEELIALARVAADQAGYYTVHMRDEGQGVLDSIEETLRIGREAGLPVHVSHLKMKGCTVWGRSREALALLDAARARGMDATQDQYPYTAACGRILLLLPQWIQEGTAADLRARLTDPATRVRGRADVIDLLQNLYAGDGSRITIATAQEPQWAGRTLADVATMGGRSTRTEDVADAVLDLVTRYPEQTATYCVFHAMCEDDVREILRNPFTAVGSDGWGIEFGAGHPHPRQYGTFPRVLGHYARDERVLTLPEALRRMTALPAHRLGLTDRGALAEGNWADLVVFDPATLRDRATFEAPHQYPAGIAWVVVNGQVAVDHGRPTGLLPGVFVPRPGR